MGRRLISSADYYAAVSNVIRCWNSDDVRCGPWLEMAAMCGTAQIAAIFEAHSCSSADRPLPVSAYFDDLLAAVANEAGIDSDLAAAFFARLFVDALSTPTLQDAFEALPGDISASMAREWASWAVAAWEARWYPELTGLAQAAVDLPAGWRILSDAFVREVGLVRDAGGALLPSATGTARPSVAPPHVGNTLPARFARPRNGVKRRISDALVYRHALSEFHDSVALSEKAGEAVTEFASIVAYLDMRTNILPAAKWVRIDLCTGKAVIGVNSDDLDECGESFQSDGALVHIPSGLFLELNAERERITLASLVKASQPDVVQNTLFPEVLGAAVVPSSQANGDQAGSKNEIGPVAAIDQEEVPPDLEPPYASAAPVMKEDSSTSIEAVAVIMDGDNAADCCVADLATEPACAPVGDATPFLRRAINVAPPRGIIGLQNDHGAGAGRHTPG